MPPRTTTAGADVPEPFWRAFVADYAEANRRKKCSRDDFAAGYRALALRVLYGDLPVGVRGLPPAGPRTAARTCAS